MANNISAFRTELFNLLAGTTNLDAATKTLIRNSFVMAFPSHWQAFLAAGNADTAANRGIFAIERTFNFWREIVRGESYKANVAAMPPPSDIT